MLACPRCSYDLSNSLDADGATCPECGWRYSRRDLFVIEHEANRSRRPRNVAPRKGRVPGWLFVLIVIPAWLLYLGLVVFFLGRW